MEGLLFFRVYPSDGFRLPMLILDGNPSHEFPVLDGNPSSNTNSAIITIKLCFLHLVVCLLLSILNMLLYYSIKIFSC
jgi:hypothetical protein